MAPPAGGKNPLERHKGEPIERVFVGDGRHAGALCVFLYVVYVVECLTQQRQTAHDRRARNLRTPFPAWLASLQNERGRADVEQHLEPTYS
jgi:hypothetical protein